MYFFSLSLINGKFGSNEVFITHMFGDKNELLRRYNSEKESNISMLSFEINEGVVDVVSVNERNVTIFVNTGEVYILDKNTFRLKNKVKLPYKDVYFSECQFGYIIEKNNNCIYYDDNLNLVRKLPLSTSWYVAGSRKSWYLYRFCNGKTNGWKLLNLSTNEEVLLDFSYNGEFRVFGDYIIFLKDGESMERVYDINKKLYRYLLFTINLFGYNEMSESGETVMIINGMFIHRIKFKAVNIYETQIILNHMNDKHDVEIEICKTDTNYAIIFNSQSAYICNFIDEIYTPIPVCDRYYFYSRDYIVLIDEKKITLWDGHSK